MNASALHAYSHVFRYVDLTREAPKVLRIEERIEPLLRRFGSFLHLYGTGGAVPLSIAVEVAR